MILLLFMMHVRFLTFEKYYRLDEYLFKENHLYVPLNFMHELLIYEAHEGRLIGHFSVVKTLDVLHKHFYWQKNEKGYATHI